MQIGQPNPSRFFESPSLAPPSPPTKICRPVGGKVGGVLFLSVMMGSFLCGCGGSRCARVRCVFWLDCFKKKNEFGSISPRDRAFFFFFFFFWGFASNQFSVAAPQTTSKYKSPTQKVTCKSFQFNFIPNPIPIFPPLTQFPRPQKVLRQGRRRRGGRNSFGLDCWWGLVLYVWGCHGESYFSLVINSDSINDST